MKWFFVLCFLYATLMQGQDRTTQRNWKPEIELGTGLSFTGYNLNLAAVWTMGDNVFHLGPKLVLSDTYLITEGPWGLHLGYRRFLARSNKLTTFAALDYQLLLTEPFGGVEKGKNATHEFHFSYGLEYRLGNYWTVGNQLGLGGYLERLIDPLTEAKQTYQGFSTLARVYIRYEF